MSMSIDFLLLYFLYVLEQKIYIILRKRFAIL